MGDREFKSYESKVEYQDVRRYKEYRKKQKGDIDLVKRCFEFGIKGSRGIGVSQQQRKAHKGYR